MPEIEVVSTSPIGVSATGLEDDLFKLVEFFVAEHRQIGA
jgi:hypothetical protein